MTVRLFTFALACTMFASVAACSSDDGGGQPSSSSTSSSSGSGSGTGSSSSSSSESSTSSSTSGGGGGTKAFGADCTASGECADGKCVRFTDNDGNERGFCSRQCTKAADCPEQGFECNISPYTACVPAKN